MGPVGQADEGPDQRGRGHGREGSQGERRGRETSGGGARGERGREEARRSAPPRRVGQPRRCEMDVGKRVPKAASAVRSRGAGPGVGADGTRVGRPREGVRAGRAAAARGRNSW